MWGSEQSAKLMLVNIVVTFFAGPGTGAGAMQASQLALSRNLAVVNPTWHTWPMADIRSNDITASESKT
jgi:hypothetical protein